MKAVIFNSGLGSRMGELTSDKPKCLVELYNGETILERQLRILSQCGIREFIITTGPYQEKIMEKAEEYPELNIIFVENPEYRNTNYIVSMHHASEYMDDDVLLLHGDLVFNRKLIEKLLADDRKSICLYHEEKELPEKDFKGRFYKGVLKEVSVSLFEEGCHAFQPLYKLSRKDIRMWLDEVATFVAAGKATVYAEDALNNITDHISIEGMSYKDDFVEEIDNAEDYVRVSEEIRFFDYREQKTEVVTGYRKALEKYVSADEKIFVVCTKSQVDSFSAIMEGCQAELFSDFSPNPRYEEVKNGLSCFLRGAYKTIVSIGGGSAIDVAKCIKLHASVDEEEFLRREYKYNSVLHIAIPTTAGTGSEATEIAVLYHENRKMSVEHPSLLPDVAVLDASLLPTLPDYYKKITMLDALCQGIESYWAKGATKESREYAVKCIRLIFEYYRAYLNGSADAESKMMLAANYSGKAINISRTTAAHAMSYKLTSLYGIGHGHGVALCIVPIWRMLHDKAQNDESLHNCLQELADVMSSATIDESIQRMERLINELNLPVKKVGREDVELLARAVDLGRMGNNPVIFTLEEIKELYKTLT